LSAAATTTTLKYKKGTGKVTVFLEGQEAPSFLPKIHTFLKRTQTLFPFTDQYDFEVHTSNSFPHSSGIASSASGMSALSLCLMSIKEVLGLAISDFFEEASEAARLGSGSGSRSLYGPMAAWGTHENTPGSNDKFAVAYHSIDPVFKSFQDTILLVDKGTKKVSSTVGHQLMEGHPYAKARFEQAHTNQTALLTALRTGNLEAFGSIVESEALTLHAMMMASTPYFILMHPNTLRVIEAVWAFRAETGTPLYFTLDAGANVHLLYPASHKNVTLSFIEEHLKTFCKNGSYLCDAVGTGPEKIG